MDNNIKDYRDNELKSYAIGNIILILLGTGLLDKVINLSGESAIGTAINAVLSSAVFSSVIYIYVFLADSLVLSQWKDKIIWFRCGMPGENIFSTIKIKCTDNRFTTEKALDVYKDIYQKMNGKSKKELKKIENSEWYKLYRKHEDKPQVYFAQRDYLLCRDMTIMTLFLLVAYICLKCYLKQKVMSILIVVFIIEFLATFFSAKNKGKRFAYNVIATDLSTRNESADNSAIIQQNTQN